MQTLSLLPCVFSLINTDRTSSSMGTAIRVPSGRRQCCNRSMVLSFFLLTWPDSNRQPCAYKTPAPTIELQVSVQRFVRESNPLHQIDNLRCYRYTNEPTK